MLRRKKKPSFPDIPGVHRPITESPVPVVTDPNGSYTGRPLDPYERPVQDADDL